MLPRIIQQKRVEGTVARKEENSRVKKEKCPVAAQVSTSALENKTKQKVPQKRNANETKSWRLVPQSVHTPFYGR